MGKLYVLDDVRARRRVPTHCVRFESEVAAQFYGEEYRRQHLYAWSLAEALKIARERNGAVEEL